MKRILSLLVVLMLAVVGLVPSSQVKAGAGVTPSAFVIATPQGEYPEVCNGVRGYQDGYSLYLTLESSYPRHSYYVPASAGLVESTVEMGGSSSLEEQGTVLAPQDFNGFRQFTIEWAQGPAQYRSNIYLSFDPAMGERQVQLVVEPQIPGMMDCYVHLPWTSGFEEVPGCPGLLESTQPNGPTLAVVLEQVDPLTTRFYRIQSVQPTGSSEPVGEHRLYVPAGELEYDTWGTPKFSSYARGGNENPHSINGFRGWVSTWSSIPFEGVYATDYRVKFAVVPGGGRTVHLVYQKTPGTWLDCFVQIGPAYEGLEHRLHIPYARK